jgi:hypothetical protein
LQLGATLTTRIFRLLRPIETLAANPWQEVNKINIQLSLPATKSRCRKIIAVYGASFFQPLEEPHK